ncbi:hypothetical protein NHX12_003985 [Muraenolepis orangiensis]|uniref:DUF4371 domain-containing protein n=1 Tax=Muraenolepis orangiensis TaxID=630683 RepID=A0A9Q0DW75_9TELE|nr:hypothetical protein NHX12_003985 [Muraenolepis orangiensis]
MHIDVRECPGNSTDGAVNMQGEYRGFSALLSAHSPQVHVWCYAHVLNLVLADTTGAVIASASLFCLLNDVAVFLRESYKRMNVGEEVSQDVRHRRLSPIGETRWWAKDAALSKVFGKFGDPEKGLYIDLIVTLMAIMDQEKVKPTVRAKANGYVEALLKYETVLTAQVFLRIFALTTPLSKIDEALDLARTISTKKHNEQVKKNRDILRKLLIAALYLAHQQQAFRGHNEAAGSSNGGNFVELFIFGLTEPLFQVLQSKTVDIKKCQDRIMSTLSALKATRTDETFSRTMKQSRQSENLRPDIVDGIVLHMTQRFADMEHLNFFWILEHTSFASFCKPAAFPSSELAQLINTYPFFDEQKLRNELHTLYNNREAAPVVPVQGGGDGAPGPEERVHPGGPSSDSPFLILPPAFYHTMDHSSPLRAWAAKDGRWTDPELADFCW